jgi:hypothetical protein
MVDDAQNPALAGSSSSQARPISSAQLSFHSDLAVG